MDFITRLVERTLGRASLAQARIASRFSPQPALSRGLMGNWQGVEEESVWGDSQGLLEQETFVERPPLSRPLPVSRETPSLRASPAPGGATPAAIGSEPLPQRQDESSVTHEPRPPASILVQRAAQQAGPLAAQAALSNELPPRRRDESGATDEPHLAAPMLVQRAAQQGEPLAPLAAPGSRLSPRREDEPGDDELQPSAPAIIQRAMQQTGPPASQVVSITSPPVAPATRPASRRLPGPTSASQATLAEAGRPALASESEPARQEAIREIVETGATGPQPIRSTSTVGKEHLAIRQTPSVREGHAPGPPPMLVPETPQSAPLAATPVETASYLDQRREQDARLPVAQEPPAPLVARPFGTARLEIARPIAADQPPAAPPSIHVHIGRVEVQAVIPPSPPPSPPAAYSAPALSLADYLKQRNEGQR